MTKTKKHKMNLEDNNQEILNSWIVVEEQTVDITQDLTEDTTSHVVEETVEVITQILPEIDVDSMIDGYRSANCCFRVDTAARNLNLTEDQIKEYLKKKYPKAQF